MFEVEAIWRELFPDRTFTYRVVDGDLSAATAEIVEEIRRRAHREATLEADASENEYELERQWETLTSKLRRQLAEVKEALRGFECLTEESPL